jgi:hypothetical protein
MLQGRNERNIMRINPSTRILARLRASFGAMLGLAAVAALPGVLQAASGTHSQLLYVVDTDHQDQDHKAQVLVVDPQQKSVVKTYPAGYHPDLAVSQDGKRLYLSYGSIDQPESGTLEVIDTATGTVIASVAAPNRVFDTFDDLVSYMALSADGGLLYVLRVKDLGNGENAYGVAVFDTGANKFLPDIISLPRCDVGSMVPSTEGRSLSVICRGVRQIRTAQFNAQGVPATRLPLGFPFGQNENPQAEIAVAFASGANQVTVIFTDGGYSRITLQPNAPVQSGVIALSPSLKETESIFGPYIPAVSDGKVFLATAAADDYRSNGMASAIAILDIKTLQQQSLLKPTKHFSSFAVGRDGTIYVADPFTATISSLRPDGTEKASLPGMGIRPTIIRTSEH